ncbi:hypothetical protein Cgig2_008577 [Carnegiea gigantea]|uniref:Uncharacterized protein n=1 Tax=Carnegiea gigantea TaxID=171969 RepID=A0A9Q1JJP1_9CARY|nr:hypothetical protein Cgig2_008577 [Carnegiea gigantea]
MSVPDPKTTGEKHGGNDNDDDCAPLRFPLRNTSQVSHDLSIKKSNENKSQVGDKPSSKKGKKPLDGSKPKVTPKTKPEPKAKKEVLAEKDDEKHVGATITPENEPLFNNCDDKEATRFVMASLKLGGEAEINVINIWSCVLNNLERKWDVAAPSILSMSCDQSYCFSEDMLKFKSFDKRYEDFKESNVPRHCLEGVECPKHDVVKNQKPDVFSSRNDVKEAFSAFCSQ